jgi:hypothetical protein
MNKVRFNFLMFFFTISLSSITYAGNDFFKYNWGVCNGNNCSFQWQKIDVSIYENADVLHLLDPNNSWPTRIGSGQYIYELKNGKILRYAGTHTSPCPISGCEMWETIDNNPRTIKIITDNGQLFQLHNNGMIWRYLGSPNNWEPVDNNLKTADIVLGGGNLYQKHNNGQIWRYTWVPCTGNLASLNCND